MQNHVCTEASYLLFWVPGMTSCLVGKDCFYQAFSRALKSSMLRLSAKISCNGVFVMWLSGLVGMRLKMTYFTPNCRQLQCDNVWWSNCRPDWDFNFCLTPVKTNRSSAADFSRVRMIYHQFLSVPCDVSVRNSCKNWLLINASFLPAVSLIRYSVILYSNDCYLDVPPNQPIKYYSKKDLGKTALADVCDARMTLFFEKQSN